MRNRRGVEGKEEVGDREEERGRGRNKERRGRRKRGK